MPFLAGANQNAPEVRPSSIRGELRWFFRALGGTLQEEQEVFGGVQGDAKSSSVLVRVCEISKKVGEEIRFSPESDKGYLYYFAKVSGNRDNVHRTLREHYLAPGTTFRLIVFLRKELENSLVQKLLLALRMFVVFGSLGLRSTRGCGAIASNSNNVTKEEIKALGEECRDKFLIRLIGDEIYSSGEKCQEVLGGFLKAFRKDHHISGRSNSALGHSSGRERMSSALRLRPVKTKRGYLPIVIYTDVACNQTSLWDLVRAETKEI